MGPVNDDDAREAEVDSCGEEDGGDCYADELHHERLLDEGIEMHLHSTNVADYFEDEAAGHGDCEANCSVVASEDELEEKEEAENGGNESVSGEGGVICVLGLKEGAGCESAFF